MKIATMAIEERASAEDFEELALVLLELDEAIVNDGERVPRQQSCRSEQAGSPSGVDVTPELRTAARAEPPTH
jgi:hypothetical protein